MESNAPLYPSLHNSPASPAAPPAGTQPVCPASPGFSSSAALPEMRPQPAPQPTLEEIASYHYANPMRKAPSTAMIPPGATGTSPSGMLSQPNSSLPGDSLEYLNGFMRSQIGRTVRVDFLIGTNTLVDKTGVLLGVGSNYILLNEVQTDDLLACDFYNIKFIHFYY